MLRWWCVGSAFPAMEVTIRGSVSWLNEKLSTTIFLLGFLGSSAGKESASNAGDPGSIPGLGRSPGEGKGYPLQYSGLENSMDCIPWGCKESDTAEQLLLFLFLLYLLSFWRSLLMRNDPLNQGAAVPNLLRSPQLTAETSYLLAGVVVWSFGPGAQGPVLIMCDLGQVIDSLCFSFWQYQPQKIVKGRGRNDDDHQSPPQYLTCYSRCFNIFSPMYMRGG